MDSSQIVKITELKGWEQNPRSINEKDFERLKKQIQKLGQYKPLVVNQDNIVLGGNMRLKALEALGVNDVWINRVETKDEAEMVEYALSDNDRAGEYNEEQLAELATLHPIDLELYKVDLGKATPLPDLVEKYGPEAEEDEPPEVDEDNIVSKLGEVYQLGKHRVMCGDSTDYPQVELLLSGAKVQMIYTDPPYGLGGYGGRNSMELKGDDEDVQKFYDAIPDAPERYIWGNFKNLANLAEVPRDVIVWVKNNFGLGQGYRGQYECCFYFGSFSGSDSDVWLEDKDNKYDHPTQKPVRLAVRAIKNSSKKGDVVLDLFSGSGSTLIACEQTGRICYGMEIDPKYVDVIRKRYAKFIGKEEEWQEVTPLVDQPS